MRYNFDEIIDNRNHRSVKWDSFPEEYLPLFVAVMDFATAPAITERLIERARHPVYGYTKLSEELFDSFIAHSDKYYGVKVEKGWLNILSGIVPGLAVASNLGKGITNTPNYGGLLDAPIRAGNELTRVPLKNTEEYYEIDFDALQESLTPDTKLFYLCNPHNPVGRVYTREELQQVSAFAKKNNLIVLADEIHCDLTLDGRKHIPFFSVDDYAREHSITFHAPGKTFNLPGVALAFAIIPNQELKEQYLKQAYALEGGGAFNIEAAIAAYRDSDAWRDELVEYLKGNRDYVEQELKRRFPKAKFTHTQGTYLQWIDFRAYGADVDNRFFQRHARIIVSGGDFFGQPGYVRLNFGCRRATLAEAFDRMEEALNKYKEEGI